MDAIQQAKVSQRYGIRKVPQRYRILWRSSKFKIVCLAHFYGTDEADAEQQLRSLMGAQVTHVESVTLDPGKPVLDDD